MSLPRLSSVLVLFVALCAPLALFGQVKDFNKSEVFGGYSWYHAGGSVNNADVPDFQKGWAAQFTYNLNHWAGLALDANGHYNDFGNVHSLAFGPQFKLRKDRFTPFGEFLLGLEQIDPKHYPNQSAAAFIIGGGIDYSPTRRFSIRPIQVDYVNAYYNRLTSTNNPFNGVRLQAGLVFKFGLPEPQGPVSATCSSNPDKVDAGIPVKIGVEAAGFLPQRLLTYSYETTGGKIAENGAKATVDTRELAPGSYTVTAKIVDDGKGKHQQTARCQAGFSVNELPKHPPVLSILADPASVKTGERSTVTVSGRSPDDRPLTYGCTATSGRLTGSGTTYTLDTTGLAEGMVTINCTANDDRNLGAASSAQVRVIVPAPAPVAKNFGAIEFKRDVLRPARVDNQAKGELDRYADALATSPDSKGVVVGYAMAKENNPRKRSKKIADIAAQRAVNTKDYVSREKGIDPTRIETRSGSSEDQKVELWIVPADASFNGEGTKTIDEAKVKAVPRTDVHRKAAHKKAAHKKSAHAKVAKQ